MRLRLAAILFAILAFAKVTAGVLDGNRPAPPEPASAPAQERPAAGLADAEFARLIERVSEPGGYFDTDNLISNEASYLHVIDRLEAMGVRGGAYIGVGPDQNFSYIARTRPEIAFLIDIRRDNALQHLWFKALFELAPTRIEYLSLLLGRRPPDHPDRWTDASIEWIIEEVSKQPAGRVPLDDARLRVTEAIEAFGLQLPVEELATIGRIHARFAEAGFGLRFTSHGRAPRSFYPTFAELLLETDRQGRRVSYLASEQDYAFVRDLQRRNLVIPVTGDLAGPSAIREIANVLRERRLAVSAFYASNVEFYLMQDGTFERFARNLAALPAGRDAMLIRSVFGRFYAHPQNVPGYYSTQVLQRLSALVRGFDAGQYRTYDDLVYGELVEIAR